MARELKLHAELIFDLASHAELTSLRSAIITFCSANSGDYRITSFEDESSQIDYYAKVSMKFTVPSRAVAASLMGTIDNALPQLPDLVASGLNPRLKYSFEEYEV